MSEQPKSWYVVQTKPKKETAVFSQLLRANYEIFLPKMQGVASPKPLFPSYVFLHADFENSQTHRQVQFTRGVRRVLGDAEGPRAIPDHIVETIRERTRDGSLIELDLLFRQGDAVRVKKGILQDLVGIIEQNLSDEKRVRVLFRWLNGTMRAVLKYTHLEKAA